MVGEEMPEGAQVRMGDLNRENTILWTLPALWAVSLFFFTVAGRYPHEDRTLLACLGAFLLAGLVLATHRRRYGLAAWALVLGCAGLVLFVAASMGLEMALVLLAVPAGLAALFVSAAGGLVGAVACSLAILWLSLGVSGELRGVALVNVWAVAGLIWLGQRPLLTVVRWSWSASQQSLRLLEQARDQRLQLKQALSDLADANVQLTRLNRLAQELRQVAEDARRAKQEFVANVSHELRTPLNMVIGFTETILQAPESYGPVPSALLADLTVILRNSQHLSSLIDDVLDLSQIEAGQMALTKEETSLAEVIDAASVAVEPLYTSKGLYLRSELAEALPTVYCDRTRIREVILNLLSNAGRFTEQGGVTIRAWREEGDLVVSVADTGPGIAAQDRERLFRPFEQLDGTTRRRYGGTGLGLSISRSFVELHGGAVWLESEIGRGSTFSFRLPIEPPAPMESGALRWLRPAWEFEQRTRRPSVAPPRVRPRLVVLEEECCLERLLRRYLGGAEVIGVHDPGQALEELRRVPTQALLVNEASVDEALARLRAAGELPDGTPAVCCYVPGAHDAADALGVSGYLLKPISRETLSATLEGMDLAGGTILVVDDDDEAARLFRRMLNSFGRGYRVLTASDGREALQLLAEARPDALLLDLMMPDMDGFQLLAHKRDDPALRDIPVVIISARDPMGEPVVTNTLTLTRGGGLGMSQLLSCIEAICGSLAADEPAPVAAPQGAPLG